MRELSSNNNYTPIAQKALTSPADKLYSLKMKKRTMTEELIKKLLEYIDARIDEKSYDAKNSPDGGLIEAANTWRIKEELDKIVQSMDKS